MHYADYKTIISPQNGMNVYRGCTHGCIYCDSRSKCYQINHVFEDIEVKRGAPRILEQQLKRKRKPVTVATGSMCDPYIPLEEKLQVTRQCLEVIERYGCGLSILTKSDLILRDLDLLKAINKKAKCVVAMTLTTLDEKLCKLIEPGASTTAQRVRVLEIMRDEGIPTVVWLCPILPFINDTEENLRGLLDYCVKAKVHGILGFGFGVTLREGNREYFYRQLDRHFPGMKQKYIKTFGNAYECRSPNHTKLMQIFTETCKRHGILYQTKDVFEYLQKFESKQKQLSLFEDTPVVTTTYDSPVGMLTLASDGVNLTGLWTEKNKNLCKGAVKRDDLPVFNAARAWLDRYFAGEKPGPNELPLAPAGSEFAQTVWKLLREIPYGKTISYGDIAKKIKPQMSAQAVGGAVGANPISIIIPCHRVIGADGSLTGYGGGVDIKAKLLEHEGNLTKKT